MRESTWRRIASCRDRDADRPSERRIVYQVLRPRQRLRHGAGSVRVCAHGLFSGMYLSEGLCQNLHLEEP